MSICRTKIILLKNKGILSRRHLVFLLQKKSSRKRNLLNFFPIHISANSRCCKRDYVSFTTRRLVLTCVTNNKQFVRTTDFEDTPFQCVCSRSPVMWLRNIADEYNDVIFYVLTTTTPMQTSPDVSCVNYSNGKWQFTQHGSQYHITMISPTAEQCLWK